MIRTIAITFAVFFALLMSGFIHRPADCALIFGARSTICTTDWSFWIMIAGGAVCIYFWDKSRPRHSEPRDEQAEARAEGRAEGWAEARAERAEALAVQKASSDAAIDAMTPQQLARAYALAQLYDRADRIFGDDHPVERKLWIREQWVEPEDEIEYRSRRIFPDSHSEPERQQWIAAQRKTL